MTRLLGPDPTMRAVWRIVGSVYKTAVGSRATFYTDAVGTTLADIRSFDPLNPTVVGSAIPSSQVTIGSNSTFPPFWFPDGIDTLYVSIDGGSHQQVNAAFDARLDSLDAGSAQRAANLADLASAATARTNLGLGTAATVNTGTGATNAILGNDSRLTDARTPVAHAATHGTVGTDAITIAESQVSGLAASLAGLQPVYATQVVSTSFSASPGTLFLVDTTGGAVAATLPAASTAGQQLVIKLNTGTNPVNLAVTGGDTIGVSATSASLTLAGEVWMLVSSGAGQWNIGGGNKTLSSLQSTFTTLNQASLLVNRGTGVQIVAHRGGGASWNGSYRGPFPEETLEGFAACLAAGLKYLNPHVCMGADGTLFCMHDATPDRTTNATGAVDVSQYTAQAWRKLKVTPTNTTLWPGYGVDWGEMHPPFFNDYLDRFGGKAVHIIEVVRRGTQTVGQVTAKVIAMLQARGLTGTAIIQSFSTGDLAPAAAVGMETMYLPPDLPNAGSDATTIQSTMTSAAGWATGKPKHVGVNAYPTGQTQAQVVTYIQSLVAAGFTVLAYGANGRYDLAWLTAAGITFFGADEPVYAASTSRVQVGADPLAQAVWPHGFMQADGARGRGNLANGGVQLDNVTGGPIALFCCYGGFSPPPSLTAYTVQADCVWDTLDNDATRHADMIVCAPDDRPTSATIGTGAGVCDGYQILFRQNGASMVVTRNSQSAQTITTLLTQTTGLPPGPSAATVTTFKVQVTATQLIISLIQGATTYGPFTVTDSTFRGGYFYLGKAYNSTPPKLVVTWKNISCG